MFCPQCGTQTVPNARFCMSCGSQLQGAPAAGQQQAPIAANQQRVESVPPTPEQQQQQYPIFLENGELSPSGVQLFTTIFNRFDTDKDGGLSHTEFNKLNAAIGEAQVDADTLGLVLDAQGIPLTQQGLSKDGFFMLMRINGKYYPDQLHANCGKLGFALPRGSFPLQPPAAVRAAYEQQTQSKVQNGLQAIQQAIAYRNQVTRMTHNMTANAIAAMPYGSGGVWRCSRCGSTIGCSCAQY